MPNQPIEGHPLIGETYIWRADRSPYDPAADDEPGLLVIAPGHHAEILAVFKNWNGVAGLDMLYALCQETGQRTHVTPADLGLPALR